MIRNTACPTRRASPLNMWKAKQSSFGWISSASAPVPDRPARPEVWNPRMFCGLWACRSPTRTVPSASRFPATPRRKRSISPSARCRPSSGSCAPFRLSAPNRPTRWLALAARRPSPGWRAARSFGRTKCACPGFFPLANDVFFGYISLDNGVVCRYACLYTTQNSLFFWSMKSDFRCRCVA